MRPSHVFRRSAEAAHPMDVLVGKRLKFRRKTLGLSQADLGKQVGITFQQIQKYKLSTNRMGASRLWEFAQTLQVSIDYFYDGYENDNNDTETLTPDTALFENKETQTLVQFYHRISDAKLRKAIVGLIRALAGSGTWKQDVTAYNSL